MGDCLLHQKMENTTRSLKTNKQTNKNPNKNSLMLLVQTNKMTWFHLRYSRSWCGSKQAKEPKCTQFAEF